MSGAARIASDELTRVWAPRPGIAGWLGVVNHKQVGRRFVVTALVFFLVGGIEALLLRIQLGAPDSTFLDPELYNQLFTMHGTTMMFLFAVPILEGLGIYVVPLMIGARDMPFPRLNAFGYWCYLFGGIFLYSSFLVGTVPDGGWFAYVPLTGPEFAPGVNLDFWLLGVTFVEVSGVVAAIELIVLILKFRAPGMSLARMPLFAWSILVTAFMVLFAFPPLIAGSVMLELDRKIGTHFYNAAFGGDPLLWQHVFWFFGHPEVYIMLLPAVGIVATVIPTFARTRIVGYTVVVTATVAIGILSFGVWVHHMYASGLPALALSFFAAASLLITIPSGVQIFAFIATLWRGTIQWSTAMLFAVGFVVLFVAGGITGVMVAIVPFDWQVHDTYFVVAHFHYVLIGGVVFPIFAGLYYWIPKLTGRVLGERLGRWNFWLMFVGFNLAFFPQHIVGLLGMPRRVYTFPGGLGWEPYNLLSTIGGMVLGTGVAVFVVNALAAWRGGEPAGADPWSAGTLEWATASPPEQFNFRAIPEVTSRDPLWEGQPSQQPGGPADWQAELTDPSEAQRLVVTTSVLDARLEEIVSLPQHSVWPLGLALGLGVFLFGVLVDSVPTGGVGLVGSAVSLIGWLWSREDVAP